MPRVRLAPGAPIISTCYIITYHHNFTINDFCPHCVPTFLILINIDKIKQEVTNRDCFLVLPERSHYDLLTGSISRVFSFNNILLNLIRLFRIRGGMRATDTAAACIQALNSPRVNFSKTKVDK